MASLLGYATYLFYLFYERIRVTLGRLDARRRFPDIPGGLQRTMRPHLQRGSWPPKTSPFNGPHGPFEEERPMNVRPLADRILVRRVEEKETMRGGIIIPDTAKEKPQEGEVVAVGPGRMTEDGKRLNMEVKKGDRVLIGKYSGTDVKIDGTEYTIIREDDVLGVLGDK
jgi:chaperonin GroES